MSKYWSLGIFLGVVLVVLVVVSLNSNQLSNYNEFKILSGKSITGHSQYCAVTCDNDAKFILSQPTNPSMVTSYNIGEGDYFSIKAKSTAHNIYAIYRYDGLYLPKPKEILEVSPFTDTSNYVKLSLVFARVNDVITGRESEIVYKFNCDGKQIVIPIQGRSVHTFRHHLRYGQEIQDFTNSFKFTEVEIHPFEDAGLGDDPSYFGFHLRPYARALVLTVGADPAQGTAEHVTASKLLVDIDSDGEPGGDASDNIYNNIGICDQTVTSLERGGYI